MYSTLDKKISFVIPCYGSEHTISFVVNDIIDTVSEKNDYEIICVNDCSVDNVYTTLKKLSDSNKNIKVVNLAKNSGQHNALMCAFRCVSGDIIVCLDDDGQTDPKQCYKLINMLNDKTDIVIARYVNKHNNSFRNFGTYLNKIMSEWLCDMPKDLVTNSYYVCKRYIIDEIVRYKNPYTFLSGLFIRTSKNIVNVDIEHKDRASGLSGYTFSKLLSLWLNGFTAFSVKPLRIASLLGFIVASLGFIFELYLFIIKLFNSNYMLGYSSLICIILFISGMIMFMAGLIGEYIGRIYICINNSPQYVIKEKINIDE